ncbi:MAG TPA: hypothetical protein DCE52_02980 [Rhodobacteraceae bacterium]|nr:hypothetical protein [Paracoccaceae bacterium]
MALIKCPECEKEVSSTTKNCPACGYVLNKPKRSIMGKIMKWAFILFNALMIFWLFSYFGEIANVTDGAGSDAEKAGAAIGGTLGTGFLLTIWVMGDIILGLFVLFTRPK